jgi:hypothetical protein
MGTATKTPEPKALGWFPIAMTVLIGAVRLLPYIAPIPYPWNFAPVGAMSLYGGARLRFWQALTLPLLLMGVTDFILWQWKGYHPDPWVYGSFAVSVLLGRLLARTNSPWRIGAVAVVATAQFFLITNFGAWLSMRVDSETIRGNNAIVWDEDSRYPIGYANNVNGLLACYAMGAKFEPEKGAPLGFALPQFFSDLLFTGLLFSAHALVRRRVGRSVPRAAPTMVGGSV